jgi:hypothetical protein
VAPTTAMTGVFEAMTHVSCTGAKSAAPVFHIGPDGTTPPARPLSVEAWLIRTGGPAPEPS